jgi:hypothetical protein
MLGVTPQMNWSPVRMTAWQKLKEVFENSDYKHNSTTPAHIWK